MPNSGAGVPVVDVSPGPGVPSVPGERVRARLGADGLLRFLILMISGSEDMVHKERNRKWQVLWRVAERDCISISACFPTLFHLE